jgi:hypothetical protein
LVRLTHCVHLTKDDTLNLTTEMSRPQLGM